MKDYRREDGSIDWTAVRRLVGIDTAGSDKDERERARSEQEFARRARALAVRDTVQSASTGQLVLVKFAVGGEIFALEARWTSGVTRARKIVPVPGVPDFVRGVCGVGGEILPILDIRSLLGLATRERETPEWLLLIGAGRSEVALLADEIVDLEYCQPQSLRSGLVSPIDTSLLIGVTDDAVAILDGSAFAAAGRRH